MRHQCERIVVNGEQCPDMSVDSVKVDPNLVYGLPGRHEHCEHCYQLHRCAQCLEWWELVYHSAITPIN